MIVKKCYHPNLSAGGKILTKILANYDETMANPSKLP
jgi:hypothetical protein